MKIEQVKQKFQPVTITLETQEEIDTIRNIIGAFSTNVCMKIGGFDTEGIFNYLDDVAENKLDNVRVTLEGE